jgi:hypothetical protein
MLTGEQFCPAAERDETLSNVFQRRSANPEVTRYLPSLGDEGRHRFKARADAIGTQGVAFDHRHHRRLVCARE